MNVAKAGAESRKLHKEGCSERVTAARRGIPKAQIQLWTAENNYHIANLQADNLLEGVLYPANMNLAYAQVLSNRGAGGIDKMSVDELLPYLKENKGILIEQLRNGQYKPNPVRRVEIPKEDKGKFRMLGIPTVVDRVVQQAIAQVLTPIYEPQFSENSYGFRPNRGAHDALRQCRKYAEEGYVYVVDMDLEKFFDTVCQSKLIELLGRSIEDGRVISLVHKYLNAGAIQNGLFEKSEQGVPQGGPLSPLLANVMLNELDKELERRGHKFVRYADDCMIFCRSKRGAERVLASITRYIEGKLFLKVNREKTSVAHISKVKYLGYTFYNHKGLRFRVHPKSMEKMKKKLREITNRNNAWSNEYRIEKLQQFIRGWVNYFKLADMKRMLREVDEWLRHRIRAIYWKQWKRVRTRIRKLRSLNLPEWVVWQLANSRKGVWRSARALNPALTNKEIANLGYMSLTGYYLQVCEN